MNDMGYAVVLGYGPQPISFFKDAAKLCGPSAVLDPDVARMAGATIAVGKPDDLAALRKRLEPSAVAEQAAAPTNASLSREAIEWLGSGERGLSSETLFTATTGVDVLRGNGYSYPHDPADLRRCRLLLEQVPEVRADFAKVAHVHPVWEALVASWDELCSCMDQETPEWRSRAGHAKQTYKLMKQILTAAGGF